MKTKRAAIYARVSTDENRQDPETQLRELRDFAERRGFEVVGEYIDHASGKTEERANYRQLLEDARRRRLDVVLVWRYDRFARSTVALVNALAEFRSLGVDFVSLQENVDTTTPQGELIFSIMASLAQFESSLISDRVKAGMAFPRSVRELAYIRPREGGDGECSSQREADREGSNPKGDAGNDLWTPGRVPYPVHPLHQQAPRSRLRHHLALCKGAQGGNSLNGRNRRPQVSSITWDQGHERTGINPVGSDRPRG
jgi:predicted site-specific integrase-resolvase